MNRRELVKMSLGASAAMTLMGRQAYAEDAPNPRSSRFLLYIHFGSSCGAANGLLQPQAPGKWPKGFFQNGAEVNANNPLLNTHTAANNLMFHDYHKFLAPIANDMCLVGATPQSLDHNVARLLQMRGSSQLSSSPEWAMGVSQFMTTPMRKNPMVLTDGPKSGSVGDVTPVGADTLAAFEQITTDVGTIPKNNADPIWTVLKNRFAKAKGGSVNFEESLGSTASFQLNTLANGLPELKSGQAEINKLKAALTAAEVEKLVSGCAEKTEIARAAANNFREQLVLAGTLAKLGLANGMTIETIGEDLHNGGADVQTARSSGGRWALIMLFWQWVRSVGLENDVMIVVGQEFARSPYNDAVQNINVTMSDGSTKSVASPGRDHALAMGMMFIHANVPKGGRVGMVTSNMVPVATKDAKGTILTDGIPYTAENIVGSMLMRCFDDLFPTERMVRKHWPTFTEIAPILS